jgi:hypothetical protein
VLFHFLKVFTSFSCEKANTEELKEKLRSIDIEKQLKEQDLTVDQLWNNFKEKVLDIMNQFSWWFVYFSWFDTCFNIHNFMV